MNAAVFSEVMRRNWRQMFYWGIGIGILGYYIVLVIPNVETLTQYQELVAALPPVILQAFGMNDAASLTTPEGFIAFGFLTYAFFMLLVYAVLAGLNITANEEDDGVLDVLLSLPVVRWRIIAEKLAAAALLMAGIVLLSFAGLLLGAQSTALPLDLGLLFAGTLMLLPGLLLVMTLTAFISVVVRRKTTAMAIVAAFIIVSYFVNFIGSAASESAAAGLRVLSFFAYVDSQEVMVSGFNVGNFLLPLVISLALVAGSLWAFERRDVGL